MPDPRTQGFAELYTSLQDPEDRKQLASRFVAGLEQQTEPNELYPLLIETGQRIGTDLTSFVSTNQPVQIAPFSPEEVEARITKAEKETPFLRKWLARVGGAVETYQEKIVEPNVATVLATLFKAIPGEQAVDRRVEQTFQALNAERRSEGIFDRLRDFRDASSQVYSETDYAFGVKGTLEFMFDPLILIGAGIPGRALKAAPALKPVLFPLKVLDEAPAAIVGRGLGTLKVPFKGIKITENMAAAIPQLKGRVGEKVIPGVPILRSLADPASQTRVINAANSAKSMAEGAFGARLFEETPTVTREILSNLNLYPDAADPRSLKGILNHILNSTPGSKWEDLIEEVNALTPEQFTNWVAIRVGAAEENALRRGGTLLSGEVDIGLSERRIAGISSFLEQAQLDVRWRNGIAKGIDNVLTPLEGFWTQKVEPLFIRPWSVAVLGSMSYVPLNLFEDVLIGVAGLGRSGFTNDATWRALTAGIEAPRFLDSATAAASTILDSKTGQYKLQPKRGILKTVQAALSGRLWVEGSATVTNPVQRSAWERLFFEKLPGAMRQFGVKDGDYDRVRQIVETAIPAEAESIRREFTQRIYVALASENPTTGLRSIIREFEPDTIIAREQRDSLKNIMELPTDARRAALRRINAGELITTNTRESLRAEMLEDIIDHHRYYGESIKEEIRPLIEALKVRDPQSLDEAMSLLRSLESMGDQLTSLPRELSARAAVEAQARPAKAKEIWSEMRRVVAEDLAELRGMYAEALTLAEPRVRAKLARATTASRSIDSAINDVFQGSRNISENLNKTWIEYDAGIRRILDDGARQFDFSTLQELRQFGKSLWNAEKRVRAREASRTRRGWQRAFNLVRDGLGKETDKTFIRDSYHAQYGEALQRIDDFRGELFQLEQARFTAPGEAVALDLDQRIGSIKEILTDEIIASRDLQKSIQEITPRSARQRQPSLIDKYVAQERTLRLSISKSDTAGHEVIARNSRKQLADLRVEKQQAIEQFIPTFQRNEYRQLLSTRDELTRIAADNPQVQNRLVALNNRITQIERLTAQGEGVQLSQALGNATQDLMDANAAKIVERVGGRPGSTEEVVEVLTILANEGDESALQLTQILADQIESADDVMTRIFGKTIGQTEARELTDLQLVSLRSTVEQPDGILTPTLQELVDKGFLTQPVQLPGRRVRLRPTDKGQAAIDAVTRDIDITRLTGDLPEPLRQWESALEFEVNKLDMFLDDAIKIAENPPTDARLLSSLETTVDKIAREVGAEKTFTDALRQARPEAARLANEDFGKMFVNYDQRTTFDWMANRLFPFWMYESRRWPRLIRLSAKRPILGKHFAASLGDWDYGYTDVGSTGFQYSPQRGVLSSTFRPVAARDYPEYHNDWRKHAEVVTEDYLGRFGFPPTFAVTAPLAILQGRGGEAIPPPISSMWHALNAAGVPLPAPFEDVFFSSRFAQNRVNNVLADEFNENPTEIAARVEDGDEEAIAVFDAARKRASEIIGIETQATVLRWKPKVRQEFLEKGELNLAEFIGISKESQETARRLGIPITSLFQISGAQWKAMRELIPNFDAQVNRNLAFLPKEEQERAIRHIRFWMAVDDMNVKSEAKQAELSAEFESARINGFQFRRENSVLMSDRAVAFEALKSQSQFEDVPLTIQQKLDYKTRFGNPPPLVHPVDELREQYFALDPEAKMFIDSLTNETDWNLFYQTREEILRSFPDNIQQVFRQDRLATATPAERALESATPYLRLWQAVRTGINKELAETDPLGPVKQQAYLQLKNLATRQRVIGNIPESQRLEREALLISAATPAILVAERRTRFRREQLRAANPEMERVWQIWIQQ